MDYKTVGIRHALSLQFYNKMQNNEITTRR